jgi:flagellar biogenesis protein FliO
MTTFVFTWLQPSYPGAEGWLAYAKVMFVLCAILLSAYLIVRFWLPKIGSLGKFSAGPIRVLARFPLEPRKTLYLVSVGKNVLLLAGSEAGVQLMTTLNPDDLDDQPARDEPGLSKSTFARLINSIRPGKKATT